MSYVTASIIAQATSSSQQARVVHTAVVHSRDGVIFSTIASSHASLLEQVADHVRPRVKYLLWPEQAERFDCLFNAGEIQSAVALYFQCVGARWDEEWLVTSVDALI